MCKLKNPASVWTMDLKNGKGEVRPGETKADCTLELTDADFMAMCTGKADPQKLFTTGKLKISGNVMAAQKLEFLKKLDPKTRRRRDGQGARACRRREQLQHQARRRPRPSSRSSKGKLKRRSWWAKWARCCSSR